MEARSSPCRVGKARNLRLEVDLEREANDVNIYGRVCTSSPQYRVLLINEQCRSPARLVILLILNVSGKIGEILHIGVENGVTDMDTTR
jgi:hypothetical protein